jgi:hypothetical protein
MFHLGDKMLYGNMIQAIKSMEMKKGLLLLVLSLLLSAGVRAQFIDNKLNVYTGGAYQIMPSKQMAVQGDFIMPSYYNNMQVGYGGTLKLVYKLHANFSTGLLYETHTFKNWKSRSELYEGASAYSRNLGTVLMFHKQASARGNLSRLRYIVQLSPQVVEHSMTMKGTPYTVVPSTSTLIRNTTSESYSGLGANLSLGVELVLNRMIGGFINYGYHQSQVNSRFHNDVWVRYQYLEAGLFLRMLHNKRYYY